MSMSPAALAWHQSSRQHGLITRAQALAAGLTERQIDRRVDRGEWLVVEPSVYRVAAAPFTWHTRLLAPCLSTGGLASHRSAAVLWGIGDARRGPPEVSMARATHLRRDRVRLHQSTDLHLAEPRVRDGIPVTGVARTLIDLGAVSPKAAVEEATIDAINKRLVTWDDLLTTFVRHARRGRGGIGAMRAVIETHLDSAIPESRLELRFLRLLRGAGLPPPQRQVVVRDGAGFVGRVDVAYVGRRIVVELDGRSVHARRQAFTRDAERRNRLTLAGWTVLTFTWEQVVGQPDLVVAQVVGALQRSVAA